MNKIVITVPDTSGINNEKQPNRNEPPISENGNTTQPNMQPNKPEQTLTQEQKTNLENIKIIMGREIKKNRMENS